MALVEADDGRLALVKAREGAILADGDEVFPDRAGALEAFARSRDVGWPLHATPGLAGGDVTGIDPSALSSDPAMNLAAAPLARFSFRRAAGVLAVAAAVACVAVLWSERETLWLLIAGPAPVMEIVEEVIEPPVMAALDAAALIAACRQALLENPPFLPAWRTERIACEGRFADPALIAARPELEGRAVLVVRWRLAPGRPEPLHRRIAEVFLAKWYAASVIGNRAWAVAPLDPALVRSDAAVPPFLDFRRDVDRRLGMRGTRIEYPQRAADGVEVRIATRRPPARLADAVAQVPGLELLRLTRDAGGEWLLEGRRVSPVSIPGARFEALTRSPDHE